MAYVFITIGAVFCPHFNKGLCFTVQNMWYCDSYSQSLPTSKVETVYSAYRVIVFHSGPALKQCTILSIKRARCGDAVGASLLYMWTIPRYFFYFKALGLYFTAARYLWLKRWKICLTQWSLGQCIDHAGITFFVSNTDTLPSIWHNSLYNLLEPT